MGLLDLLGKEQRNAGGLSALSSVRVSLGLTIGTLAADFQDSKRRLQPLPLAVSEGSSLCVLENRQSGARQHKESRAISSLKGTRGAHV